MEKGIQQRQNAAIRGLVIFHHQLDRVLLQRHFQFGKIETRLVVAKGKLQLACLQQLGFRQQRRQVWVQRMLWGK
ncbi:hypothetical protein D3C80_1995430 [compost metagenome]